MRSTIKQSTLGLILLLALNGGCKDGAQNKTTTADQSTSETVIESNKGQAFISDDESTPTVLSIAINSPDHTTLVAAVQAASLENALVNAGPLMVFAPTNDAFDALPEGTVEAGKQRCPGQHPQIPCDPGQLFQRLFEKFQKIGTGQRPECPC